MTVMNTYAKIRYTNDLETAFKPASGISVEARPVEKPYKVAQPEIIMPNTRLLKTEIAIVLNESAVKRFVKYSAILVVEIN